MMPDDYRAPCREAVAGTPKDPRGCRGCGGPLAPRRKFYCADDACRETFEREHFWQSARRALLAISTVWDVETRKFTMYVCWHCGQDATLREAPDPQARMEGIPGGYAGRRMGRLFAPEVNHRVPVNGVRPFFGCHAHWDGLEVLCRACHSARHRGASWTAARGHTAAGWLVQAGYIEEPAP